MFVNIIGVFIFLDENFDVGSPSGSAESFWSKVFWDGLKRVKETCSLHLAVRMGVGRKIATESVYN